MSQVYEIEHVVCRGCFALLDVEDNFCRHCGARAREIDATADTSRDSAAPPTIAATASGPANAANVPLTENRWVVLGTIFFVLGPAGLPMLWRSRAFSLTAKITLSVIVIGACVAAIGLIWLALQRAIAPLSELDAVWRR